MFPMNQGQYEQIKQVVKECLAKYFQPILERLEYLESKYDKMRDNFQEISKDHQIIKREIQQIKHQYLSFEDDQGLAKQMLSKTDSQVYAKQNLPEVQNQMIKACSQFNTESNLKNPNSHQLAQSIQTQQINNFKISGDQIVYKTIGKAKKFHKKNCGTFANTKEIIAVQREKAISDGLEGCGICKV